MRVTIKPSLAGGTVCAPPSKSMSHRLLICAGMSDGESVISSLAPSEDVLATIDCLRAMGVQVDFDVDNSVARVRGVDFRKASPKSELFCRESGSTLRFFLPSMLLSGEEVTLTGAPSLMRRPMDVYSDFCKKQKLRYEQSGNAITVRGVMKAGKYTIPGNISSQFISGLLFALPLLDGNSTISITPPIESRSYISLTIAALEEFGVSVKWKDEKTLFVEGNQSYRAHDCTVEGDYSNAAFLDGFNLLGGDVTVTGLKDDSLQGDRIYSRYYDLLKIGSPAIHIGDCPDLGPVLFALAAAGHGGIFSGTRRLKIKESDRVAAMAQELSKFGVSVTVEDDSVVIYPSDFHAPTEPLNGHNDHRIVMSLALLLSKTGGVIEGAQAVEKSYPTFFSVLSMLGIDVSVE
ncbi:MAG: 3-phosphoshikimate 1-carboxyvinyltransferase [Clostridia bacterium]|nr:3-phosphoshikimate 1-carboxyvinyltransferase [Clostridia bacterium]